MPNSNEVTSPPATAPAQAAPETNGDGRKGNMSEASVTRLLAQRISQRLEQAAQTTAPDAGSSNVAAASTETPAAPVESAQTQANPEQVSETQPAQPQAENQEPAKDDSPDVLSNFSHLDPKTREVVESALKQFKDKNHESVEKRIGKEVAKRKALEEELAKTKALFPQRSPLDPTQPPAQAAQAPAQQAPQQAPLHTPAPTDQPLSHITDYASLAKEETTAKEIYRVTDDALALGPNHEGKYVIEDKAYTKEQIVTARRNAGLTLQEHVPQRRQFLAMREQNRTLAMQHNPWLADPTSQEFQKAAAIAQQYPVIKTLPNAENVLGLLVRGLNSLESELAAKKVPAKPQRTAAVPPSDQVAFNGVGSAATRLTSDMARGRAVQDEREKLKGTKGVSARNAARFLLASDPLRTSR